MAQHRLRGEAASPRASPDRRCPPSPATAHTHYNQPGHAPGRSEVALSSRAAVLRDLITADLPASQAGSLVEPAGPGLVTAAPPGPVQVVASGLPDPGDQVEDPLDLGGGERDQARVLGWQIVG